MIGAHTNGANASRPKNAPTAGDFQRMSQLQSGCDRQANRENGVLAERRRSTMTAEYSLIAHRSPSAARAIDGWRHRPLSGLTGKVGNWYVSRNSGVR